MWTDVDKFESIIARIKGLVINHAMERIENAGQKDWRADHARLALIDSSRFGSQAGQQNNTQVNVYAGDSIVKSVLERCYNAPQLTQDSPKQLPSVVTVDEVTDKP